MKWFAVALSCFAGLAVAATPPTRPAPLPGQSVYNLAAPMTDQAGRDFAWASRRGRPQLVSMFYTSCRYTCPLIIDSAQAVQRELATPERARLDVLLVSMDPKRDTPEALASVATLRKLDPARWTLARPHPQDVRPIAGVLGVRYRELADGDFNHTSALVLLDADGRILARTEKLGTVPDPEFMAVVHQALAPVAAR